MLKYCDRGNVTDFLIRKLRTTVLVEVEIFGISVMSIITTLNNLRAMYTRLYHLKPATK